VSAPPVEVPLKNNGYCAHPANAARGVAPAPRRVSCAGQGTCEPCASAAPFIIPRT
jgi:hypothetical protein